MSKKQNLQSVFEVYPEKRIVLHDYLWYFRCEDCQHILYMDDCQDEFLCPKCGSEKRKKVACRQVFLRDCYDVEHFIGYEIKGVGFVVTRRIRS